MAAEAHSIAAINPISPTYWVEDLIERLISANESSKVEQRPDGTSRLFSLIKAIDC